MHPEYHRSFEEVTRAMDLARANQPMKNTRSLETITHDLDLLSPADRQAICALAYDLKALDYAKESEVSYREAAMRRLLRDITNKQAGDVRTACIQRG